MTLVLLAVPVAVAQETADERQRAKEARIAEYLQKKEQRRLDKDARRQEKVAATAPDGPTVAELGGDTLPRELARAQDAVRASAIGADPTIQRYLDLIERQEASAHQLAAFGNFVADAGMAAEAEVYYNVALSLERGDPALWINYGTLMRQLGDLPKAGSAYGRALEIDPNNALAHYNLATVLEAQGKYEDSISAYSVALMLDPSLGDPTVNPAAANNKRLVAVKLMLYQQQTGSLGTPLVEIPEGGLPEEGDVDD